MIKKWVVETIKLDDVKQLPKNCRYINNKNLAGLKKSLDRFGAVELPVYNRTTGHLVSGHQRTAILKERGITETTMIVVEMDADEEQAAALTVNNPTISGTFTPAVMDIMDDLEASSNEMFKDLNLDVLRVSLKDFAPKIPPNPESGSTDFNVPKDTGEGLTTCPCCKHRFLISAKDVVVSEV